MSNLRLISAQTCAADYLTDERIDEIKAELTSSEAKYRFARALLEDAATLYSISDQDLDDLARQFVDPSTRRDAECSMTRFPFKDPKTEWAAHGYSLVMDRIYAEDDPNADVHVVAVPAHWSLDLWHHDRDLCDDGYHYQRWVYATLPHIVDHDREVPMAYVLISEDVYGTLHWGDQIVSLYRGEVTISQDHSASRTMALIAEAAALAVQ